MTWTCADCHEGQSPDVPRWREPGWDDPREVLCPACALAWRETGAAKALEAGKGKCDA